MQHVYLHVAFDSLKITSCLLKSDNFNAALNHAHVVYKLILNLEDYTRNTSTDLFLTKL